jgi:hypothetical protein
MSLTPSRTGTRRPLCSSQPGAGGQAAQLNPASASLPGFHHGLPESSAAQANDPAPKDLGQIDRQRRYAASAA